MQAVQWLRDLLQDELRRSSGYGAGEQFRIESALSVAVFRCGDGVALQLLPRLRTQIGSLY